MSFTIPISTEDAVAEVGRLISEINKIPADVGKAARKISSELGSGTDAGIAKVSKGMDALRKQFANVEAATKFMDSLKRIDNTLTQLNASIAGEAGSLTALESKVVSLKHQVDNFNPVLAEMASEFKMALGVATSASAVLERYVISAAKAEAETSLLATKQGEAAIATMQLKNATRELITAQAARKTVSQAIDAENIKLETKALISQGTAWQKLAQELNTATEYRKKGLVALEAELILAEQSNKIDLSLATLKGRLSNELRELKELRKADNVVAAASVEVASANLKADINISTLKNRLAIELREVRAARKDDNLEAAKALETSKLNLAADLEIATAKARLTAEIRVANEVDKQGLGASYALLEVAKLRKQADLEIATAKDRLAQATRTVEAYNAQGLQTEEKALISANLIKKANLDIASAKEKLAQQLKVEKDYNAQGLALIEALIVKQKLQSEATLETAVAKAKLDKQLAIETSYNRENLAVTEALVVKQKLISSATLEMATAQEKLSQAIKVATDYNTRSLAVEEALLVSADLIKKADLEILTAKTKLAEQARVLTAALRDNLVVEEAVVEKLKIEKAASLEMLTAKEKLNAQIKTATQYNRDGLAVEEATLALEKLITSTDVEMLTAKERLVAQLKILNEYNRTGLAIDEAKIIKAEAVRKADLEIATAEEKLIQLARTLNELRNQDIVIAQAEVANAKATAKADLDIATAKHKLQEEYRVLLELQNQGLASDRANIANAKATAAADLEIATAIFKLSESYRVFNELKLSGYYTDKVRLEGMKQEETFTQRLINRQAELTRSIDSLATAEGKKIIADQEEEKLLKRQEALLARQDPTIQALIRSIKLLEAEERKLYGTTAELNASFNITAQSMSALRSALTGLSSSLGTFTSSTILVSAGVFAVTRAIKEAIVGGAEYENLLTRVAAIASKTSGDSAQYATDLASLSSKAMEIAATTRYMMGDVMSAMEQLATDGMNVQEILTATKNVMDLAAVGAIDFGQASDIATNILKGFGLEVSDLGHVVDVMTMAITNSNENIQQMGTAMSYAAPIASSYGISLEMVSAATEVLANAGIRAGRAGTSLRRIITSIFTPTQMGSAAMKQFGISTAGAVESLEGLESMESPIKGLFTGAEYGTEAFVRVLKQLYMATDGATTNLRLLLKVADLRTAPAFITLIKSLGDGKDNLLDIADGLSGVAGKTDEIVTKMQDNVLAKWQTMLGAIDTAGKSIFMKIAKSLQEFLESVNGTLQTLANNGGFLDGVIASFKRLADGVLQVVSAIILFKTVSTIFAVLKTLTIALASLSATMYALSAGTKTLMEILAVSKIFSGFAAAATAAGVATSSLWIAFLVPATVIAGLVYLIAQFVDFKEILSDISSIVGGYLFGDLETQVTAAQAALTESFNKLIYTPIKSDTGETLYSGELAQLFAQREEHEKIIGNLKQEKDLTMAMVDTIKSETKELEKTNAQITKANETVKQYSQFVLAAKIGEARTTVALIRKELEELGSTEVGSTMVQGYQGFWAKFYASMKGSVADDLGWVQSLFGSEMDFVGATDLVVSLNEAKEALAGLEAEQKKYGRGVGVLSASITDLTRQSGGYELQLTSLNNEMSLIRSLQDKLVAADSKAPAGDAYQALTNSLGLLAGAYQKVKDKKLDVDETITRAKVLSPNSLKEYKDGLDWIYQSLSGIEKIADTSKEQVDASKVVSDMLKYKALTADLIAQKKALYKLVAEGTDEAKMAMGSGLYSEALKKQAEATSILSAKTDNSREIFNQWRAELDPTIETLNKLQASTTKAIGLFQYDGASSSALAGLTDSISQVLLSTIKLDAQTGRMSETSKKAVDGYKDMEKAAIDLAEAEIKAREEMSARLELELMAYSTSPFPSTEKYSQYTEALAANERALKQAKTAAIGHKAALSALNGVMSGSIALDLEKEAATLSLADREKTLTTIESTYLAVLEQLGNTQEATFIKRRKELAGLEDETKAYYKLKYALEDLQKTKEEALSMSDLSLSVMADITAATDALQVEAGSVYVKWFDPTQVIEDVDKAKTELSNSLEGVMSFGEGSAKAIGTSFDTLDERVVMLKQRVMDALAEIKKMSEYVPTIETPSSSGAVVDYGTGQVFEGPDVSGISQASGQIQTEMEAIEMSAAQAAGRVATLTTDTSKLMEGFISVLDSRGVADEAFDKQVVGAGKVIPLIDELATRYGVTREAALSMLDAQYDGFDKLSNMLSGSTDMADWATANITQDVEKLSNAMTTAASETEGLKLYSSALFPDDAAAATKFYDKAAASLQTLKDAAGSATVATTELNTSVSAIGDGPDVAEMAPAYDQVAEAAATATVATSQHVEAVTKGAEATEALAAAASASVAISSQQATAVVGVNDALTNQTMIVSDLALAQTNSAAAYKNEIAAMTELMNFPANGSRQAYLDLQNKLITATTIYKEALKGEAAQMALVNAGDKNNILTKGQLGHSYVLQTDKALALAKSLGTLKGKQAEYSLAISDWVDAYKSGVATLEEMRDAVEKLSVELESSKGGWSEYWADLKSDIPTAKDFSIDVFDEFKGTLVDMLTDGVDGKMDDFVDTIKKKLAALAVNTIVVEVIGMFTGSTNTVAGQIASATGAATGTGSQVSGAIDTASNISKLGNLSKAGSWFSSKSIGSSLSSGYTSLGGSATGSTASNLSSVSNLNYAGATIIGTVIGEKFFGNGTTQSQTGAAIGSTAGAVIGSAILPVIGTYIGSALGGALGAKLGSLFGKVTKQGNYATSFSGKGMEDNVIAQGKFGLNFGLQDKGTTGIKASEYSEVFQGMADVTTVMSNFYGKTLSDKIQVSLRERLGDFNGWGKDLQSSFKGMFTAILDAADQAEGWVGDGMGHLLKVAIGDLYGTTEEMANQIQSGIDVVSGVVAYFGTEFGARLGMETKGYFSTMEESVRAMNSYVKEFSKSEETSAETINRLATDSALFETSAILTGLALEKLNLSGSQYLNYATKFVEAAEKIGYTADTLATALDAYYTNFFSAEEQALYAQKAAQKGIDEFNEAIGRVGSTTIDTKEELRSYVDSLGGLLSSGKISQDTYDTLFLQAIKASSYFQDLATAVGTAGDAADSTTNSIDDFVKSLRSTELSQSEDMLEMTQLFTSWGMELPATSDALYALIKAGKLTDAQILELSKDSDKLTNAFSYLTTVRDKAISELTDKYNAKVDKETDRYNAEVDSINAASDARKEALDAAYDKLVDSINSQIDTLEDAVSSFGDVVDSVTSALRTLLELSDGIDETRQRYLKEGQDAVAAIRAGGKVPDNISDIIDGLSSVDPNDFANKAEYENAILENMRVLTELKSAAGTKKDVAQAQLDALNAQLDQAKTQYDANVAAEDARLERELAAAETRHEKTLADLETKFNATKTAIENATLGQLIEIAKSNGLLGSILTTLEDIKKAGTGTGTGGSAVPQITPSTGNKRPDQAAWDALGYSSANKDILMSVMTQAGFPGLYKLMAKLNISDISKMPALDQLLKQMTGAGLKFDTSKGLEDILKGLKVGSEFTNWTGEKYHRVSSEKEVKAAGDYFVDSKGNIVDKTASAGTGTSTTDTSAASLKGILDKLTAIAAVIPEVRMGGITTAIGNMDQKASILLATLSEARIAGLIATLTAWNPVFWEHLRLTGVMVEKVTALGIAFSEERIVSVLTWLAEMKVVFLANQALLAAYSAWVTAVWAPTLIVQTTLLTAMRDATKALTASTEKSFQALLAAMALQQTALVTINTTLGTLKTALTAKTEVAKTDTKTEVAKKIPGYATGGYHSGGLRIVGEQGPELEATGPSFILAAGKTKELVKSLKAVQDSFSALSKLSVQSSAVSSVASAGSAIASTPATKEVTKAAYLGTVAASKTPAYPGLSPRIASGPLAVTPRAIVKATPLPQLPTWATKPPVTSSGAYPGTNPRIASGPLAAGLPGLALWKAQSPSWVNSVHAFAEGGAHTGGLRLVGEEGPELEYTAPSYITDAGTTRSLLDTDELLAEMKALKEEMKNGNKAVASNTGRAAAFFDRWERIGMPQSRNDIYDITYKVDTTP